MKTLERVALVVALALALVGLLLPAQSAPVAPVTSSQGLTFGTSNFGGSISVAGDATVVGAVTGGSLTVGGVAQTGAIKYGTQSAVISGTTIAHGVGTTPTVFMVEVDGIQVAALTQTLYHGGCNVTSCTVYLTQGSVTTFTVDWLAGK